MSSSEKIPFAVRFLPLVACLAILLGQTAHAQSTNDGSIYSSFGVGELRTFPSAQIQALGGGGTGILSFNYLNSGNPATWSDQVLTRFSGGVFFQGVEASDAAGNTSTLTEGTLNTFQLSFPIQDRKLGVALGYEPYSRMNYRVQLPGALEPDPVLGDTNTFLLSNVGSGGLQRVIGGVGYRFNENFSVGASLNYVFGILENTRRTEFERQPGFENTHVATSTRLSGLTGTLGATFTVPTIVSDNDYLSIGAAVTLPASLSGTRVRTLSINENAEQDTLGTPVDGSLTLPLRAQVGAAFMYDDRWTFVADALYEPWSSFDSDFALGGFDPEGTSNFNDRIRASFGAEFLPAGNNMLRPFLARVAYRLGFYYDQAYVTPEQGASLNTIALTGGFGLPTLIPGTRFDLGFEAGMRGSAEGDLIRDRFYRISASINFGERWFEQRRLR